MADPFPEQILDAIVTKVTGLATTGQNVARARVYQVDPSVNSSLTVMMGSDNVASILNNEKIDWELTVNVLSTVRATSGIDQTINSIRAEVHAALMADYTLGLPFVIDVVPVSADEPELSGDGDMKFAMQRMEYTVRYRTSRTSISA